MSSTGYAPTPSAADAASVLAYARTYRATADLAEVNVLRSALAWAQGHPPRSEGDISTQVFPGCDGESRPAGPGAPAMSEFAVTEYAAALGMSTDAGRDFLGNALELAYRLPRTWARVLAGDLLVWKARRIASTTTHLPLEGADFVDRHIAAVAHKIGPTQFDRLITEALDRFDPHAARAKAEAAADGRCVDIDTRNLTTDGTVWLSGSLDLADALDLDRELNRRATLLGLNGCDASWDARRAMAAGDLARTTATGQDTLPLHTDDIDHTVDTDETGRPTATATDMEPADQGPTEDAGEPDQHKNDEPDDQPDADTDTRSTPTGPTPPPGPTDTESCTGSGAGTGAGSGEGSGTWPYTVPQPPRRPRDLVLYVHLTQAALEATTPSTCTTGASQGESRDVLHLARVQNTRTPITVEQVQSWCGPDTKVTVKPVIDLAGHIATDAYEAPDRLKEQVDLRDVTCRFPWCTMPAARCDHDHITPHARGGPTCSCNIALLCRRHHRVKTHGAWTYQMVEPGVFMWRSPHGHSYLRDHTGTTDVTPDPDPPPDQSTARPPDQ